MAGSSSIQAFVKVVPDGGTKSASALSTQSSYTSNYAEASENAANLDDISAMIRDYGNTYDAENSTRSSFGATHDNDKGPQDGLRTALDGAINQQANAHANISNAPSPHKMKVYLRRSERYFGINIEKDQLSEFCKEWTEQTGVYTIGQESLPSDPELTTHIVISFPEQIDDNSAHAAARDWAAEMFDSGKYGGKWDYITAFHTNRPHPHLHVIVNRRELENGDWLKISKRNEHINYDSMRDVLVQVAAKQSIKLEATSRKERGLEGTTVSLAKHHMQARGVYIAPAERLAKKKATIENWRFEAASASAIENVEVPNNPANLPTHDGGEDLEAVENEGTPINTNDLPADGGENADMELRSGRRVGEPPAKDDEDTPRNDRVGRDHNNQRGE